MTSTQRRTMFVTLLTMLTNPPAPSTPAKDACPLCGHEGKCDTGECSFCGTYKCSTCSKYHLGDPRQTCNGHGVEIPGAT